MVEKGEDVNVGEAENGHHCLLDKENIFKYMYLLDHGTDISRVAVDGSKILNHIQMTLLGSKIDGSGAAIHTLPMTRTLIKKDATFVKPIHSGSHTDIVEVRS